VSIFFLAHIESFISTTKGNKQGHHLTYGKGQGTVEPRTTQRAKKQVLVILSNPLISPDSNMWKPAPSRVEMLKTGISLKRTLQSSANDFIPSDFGIIFNPFPDKSNDLIVAPRLLVENARVAGDPNIPKGQASK
jgi:hypothetical protein